jgi:hypothetical protein
MKKRETPKKTPPQPPAAAIPRLRAERFFLVLILGVALALLVANLGSPRLWQDEAETALLGRNTLRFGLPRVWDGENLVAQYYSIDFNGQLLHQKPWLPFYLVAASFAGLGESTFAARLPFALCGLLTVFLTWRLARRLTQDPVTALIAALLLTASLPFLLYSRQCRWYGASMALTLLLFEAEERLGTRRGWIAFGAALAGLFHTNYLVAGCTLPGLLIGRLWTRGPGALDRPLFFGLGLAALLTAPFLVAFPPFNFAGEAANLSGIPENMAWVLGDLNRYLLPIPFFVMAVAFGGRGLLQEAWLRRTAAVLALAVPLASVTLWPGLVKIIGFRYLVNLLPLAALALSGVLRTVCRGRPALLVGLLALNLATNLPGFPLTLWPPAARPGFFRTDLVDYVRDALAPVKGPVDAAVEWLADRAKPGQFFYTPYEHLPFQFYTSLKTVGLQGAGQTLAGLGVSLPAYVSALHPETIDYYLPRRDWVNFDGAPGPAELLRFMGRRGTLAGRFVLDAPDLPWQTREYPPLHPFRRPDLPAAEIYTFPRNPGESGNP